MPWLNFLYEVLWNTNGYEIEIIWFFYIAINIYVFFPTNIYSFILYNYYAITILLNGFYTLTNHAKVFED
jgi:hypothetical protein